MWILRNDEKGYLYGVTLGKVHVVSRKDGDLLLRDDQSISRKHAHFRVADNGASSGIVVKDLQSKYGTWTTAGSGELVQLPSNQEITLQHGDQVRFGIQWNCWRVEFSPLLVATSTLTQDEKTEVKALVSVLGGQVVGDWENRCTHLTMNKLTVTVKVVCALAVGQPIVTPAFWRSISQAFGSVQATLPVSKDFAPPLAETMLDPSKVSFHPNAARAALFNGYTFVASTDKQLSRIKPMVEAAGGTAVLFSPKLWTLSKLKEKKTILMQHSSSERQGSQQSQIPDGYIINARKMKAEGVRCIPESEIGLSVLYCSMTPYCNPSVTPQLLANSSNFTEPVDVTNTENNLNSESSSLPEAEPANVQTYKKRANERTEPDESFPRKKAKHDSEDVFGSQNIPFQNTESNPKLASCSSMSPIASENANPVDSSNNKENKPAIHNPSLDMFAPSGERSIKIGNVSLLNQSEARPSCEDMFGSRGTKGSTSSANQQVKIPKTAFDDINDDFSFPSRKKTKRPSSPKDQNDDFSFSSRKRAKVEEVPPEDGDVFSFASTRRSRRSNTDIFAPSGETPSSSSAATSSKEKNVEDKDEVDLRQSRHVPEKDLFAFPEAGFSKKKRVKESLNNSFGSESEVKLALLSKMNPNSLVIQNRAHSPNQEDVPEGEKSHITYRKEKSTSAVLEAVKNEEIDELVRDFFNATIVVVKPLLASKAKPLESSSAANTTVKNFKKFRKVIGVRKQVIPHIIDLIPHHKETTDDPDDELRPPSPLKQVPDDDWTFLGDKKKGRR